MSLDQCRWRDITHFESSDFEDSTFDTPYALIGKGTDPAADPLVAAHRRGEVPVGWLNGPRVRALGARLNAELHSDAARGVFDDSVEVGVCFHVLAAPSDMAAVMQCGAGAPPVPNTFDAPLPRELPHDTPAALGWAATADGRADGPTIIENKKHADKDLLLGIVPGWPARLAAPMVYVHRVRPAGQGVPRLRAVDLPKLEALAHTMEAEGTDKIEVDGPILPGPKICVHRVQVGPAGYDAIAAQVSQIRRECMGL